GVSKQVPVDKLNFGLCYDEEISHPMMKKYISAMLIGAKLFRSRIYKYDLTIE
ncbi:11905_t:CDS:2, partial [Racocetra persica]